MATNSETCKQSCVKCKIVIDKHNEKLLKCNGACGEMVHYGCSIFKPTELKFMDVYKENVKWYCNQCNSHINKGGVSEEFYKLNELELYVKESLKLIREQSKVIEKQNVIINKIEAKLLAENQTIAVRPITRSMATADGPPIHTNDNDAKSKSKAKNSPNKKDETQITKQQKVDADIADKNKLQPKQKMTISPDNKKDTHNYATNISTKPTITETNIDAMSIDNGAESQSKFKEVSYKKKTVRGTKENTILTAVENRKWIFVSNLIKTTTESDVRDYLSGNNIDTMGCYKLTLKNSEIAAFKVAILSENYEQLFSADLWPVNTIIRPFKNFRRTVNKSVKL